MPVKSGDFIAWKLTLNIYKSWNKLIAGFFLEVIVQNKAPI